MESNTVHSITLWDLISTPTIFLNPSLYALFLLFAILLECSLSKRDVSPGCTLPTVFILIVTYLLGLVWQYALMAHRYSYGERIEIPHWYYPAIGLFLLGVAVLFGFGASDLLKKRCYANCTGRCLIFAGTIGFFLVSSLTPTRANRLWDSEDEKGPGQTWGHDGRMNLETGIQQDATGQYQ